MVKTKNAYKNMWLWILATVVLGTLWHFGYELFGRNFITGMVFPINESVWEHQKIVYFPLLIAGMFGFAISKPKNPAIWLGTLVGNLLAMTAVFFGFYLYSSIIGESLLADIALYIASVILGMYSAWWVAINVEGGKKLAPFAIATLVFIGIILVYLTINPPKFGPFIETSSQTYGIYEKSAK